MKRIFGKISKLENQNNYKNKKESFFGKSNAKISAQTSLKNKYSFKNKSSYFETGRWISPVIEYETWLDWTRTKEAKLLKLDNSDPAYIVVDGHYFSPKRGVYSQLVKKISKEFESGDFKIANYILNLAESISNECLKLANNARKKQTLDNFLHCLRAMSRLRFPWMSVFAIGDASDNFLNKYANIKKISLDQVKEEIPLLANSLTIDQKELSNFKEKIKKYKLAFNINNIKKRNPTLANDIISYQKKTEYIGTHHFWGDERSLSRLFEAIENAGPKYKQNISNETKENALEIIARATKWRLECAQSSAFLAYACRPYLIKLAKSNRISYNDLIFLTSSEIKTLAKKRDIFLPIIRERQRGTAVFKLNSKIHVLTGRELNWLKKHFGLLEKINEVDSFKGSIGNKGVVSGIVAIVLQPADQHKVRSGMILVSPETTPDLIPSMGRAAAFVTDYGGITSHAAIVAREMRKPCITGAKIATKVLKDGDEIEVDADKGIVRIIKK